MLLEFPSRPIGDLKQHITTEADGRLQHYLTLPPDPNAPPDFEPPPRPQLPLGTVDTPLVRLLNFLRKIMKPLLTASILTVSQK